MKKVITLFISAFCVLAANAQIPFGDFVFVEGGTFYMGAQKTDPYAPNYDTLAIESYYEYNLDLWIAWEAPVHQVTLNSFHIGKYEATQAEWCVVMGNNPSSFKDIDNKPVETIRYGDIQSFINTLNSKQSQYVYRLPTEAEWEFAARGGNQSAGYIYSGSNDVDDVSWHGGVGGNAENITHIVGTKAPNELGIYDMSGNVYEYCSDFFGDYSSEPQTNPTGNHTGTEHIVRGGSWYSAGKISRVADRTTRSTNSTRFSTDGFRLVRSEISGSVPAASISLNKDETTINLSITNIEELTATILPANASNKLIYWQSSDKNIALVDNTGKITCRATGECTITATTIDGNHTATCNVTVTTYPGWAENQTDNIKIYPNPVKDELRIGNYELCAGESVQILDLTGRIVGTLRAMPTTGNDTATINVSHLANGIYFVKIQTDKGNFIEKFVKK